MKQQIKLPENVAKEFKQVLECDENCIFMERVVPSSKGDYRVTMTTSTNGKKKRNFVIQMPDGKEHKLSEYEYAKLFYNWCWLY